MIDLRRLRQVVVLADMGNFLRAADALGISQPALSRSIQSIEADYGVRLFDRSTNSRVEPTVVGMALIREARHLLRDADAVDQTLRLMSRAAIGSLSFGLGPVFASAVLPSIIARLATAHPSLIVNAVIENGGALSRLLLQDEVEFCCCLRDAAIPSDQLEIRKIGQTRVQALVRAGHPLLSEANADLARIAEFTTVGGRMQSEGHELIWPIRCDNFEVLKAATLDSDIVWITSLIAAREEIARGKLVPLPDHPLSHRRDFDLVLIRRLRRTPSPAAQMVMDHIVQILADSYP